MSILDTRNALVQTVTNADLNVNVYAHLPEGVALPCAVVHAGTPYIEQGDTFSSHIARYDVWLSADHGDNGSQTMQLDEFTEALIQEALEDDWDIESITQPFMSTYTDTLTISITVTTSVRL